MNTQKEKIKLNIPCSICNKELFLGTSLVSFGDERTPVHLECYNKVRRVEAKKQVMEIIDKCVGYSDYQPNMIVISEDELKSKIGVAFAK